MQKLFWSILSLLLISCGNNAVNRTLKTAEDLMSERPDSALQILSEINPIEISSNEQNARYALLLSQAYDKNYVDKTNDSLINIAVEYYTESSQKYYTFLSLYYHGRIMYNANRYNDAVLSFTKAEQLIETFNIPNAKGLLYANMGLIYRKIYDYPKSLNSYQKAMQYYKESGNSFNEYNCIMEIGQSYYYLRDLIVAEKYLTEAIEYHYSNENNYECQNCFRFLISTYELTGDIDKIYSLYESKYYTRCHPTLYISENKAYLCAIKGNKTQAEEHLMDAWAICSNFNDTLDLHITSYNIYKRLNDYPNALQHLEKVASIQDSLVNQTLKEPITTTQRDFYRQNSLKNEYKLKVNRLILTFCIICSILIISILILIYRQRSIKKEAEIIKFVESVKSLQLEIYHKNKELSKIKDLATTNSTNYEDFTSNIYHLFNKQFDLLDKLGRTYYESSNDVPNIQIIYKRVKSGLDSFCNDCYDELEVCVNQYKDNVMAKLREQINLKEEDYKIICYYIAGFSAKAISVFTGISIQNIYARKSRIKNNIINTKPADCVLFHRYLS